MPSGEEEHRTIDVGEIAWIGSPASGADVLDQHGARGGAVGLPQTIAVGAVEGENNRPLTLVSTGDWPTTSAEVLDQHGAGGGAVGLPQFRAVENRRAEGRTPGR